MAKNGETASSFWHGRSEIRETKQTGDVGHRHALGRAMSDMPSEWSFDDRKHPEMM